jgi:hypothetical protein
MRLVQFLTEGGNNAVAQVLGEKLQLISKYSTSYELANKAIELNKPLEELVLENRSTEHVDYSEVFDSERLLSPISHQDPARFWITGTGLTHSGSAATRDTMHAKMEKEEDLSDSMKIFKMGMEGGRPEKGKIGVQPEWFYKGNGTIVVPPNGNLDLPDYALDGGEEPEIAGLYLIGPDGTPYRVGYALGNEYSDHITERINYLYLAHSKLRQCSFGPELLLGELPKSVKGKVTVIRDGETLWTKEFLSGEENMIHNFHNLEYHHFKYDLFRNPSDLHCHFFGTATFSFSEGIKIEDGDRFQIESDVFGKVLRNTVKKSTSKLLEVKKL